MKDIIKTLLAEWEGKKLPEVIKREIDLIEYGKLKVKKIIALTGFRRVGKTYLLLGLANALLEKMQKDEIVYLNFEDERIPLKAEFLTALLPVIREVSGKGVKVLLLDEIQGMPDWGRWLRRVYDTENIALFISGSSSKMSGREIPTELRGRFLEVRVFPLSFREFLSFKNLKFDFQHIEHSQNEKAMLLHALGEYLEYGGMPEIVISEEGRKSEIANSYYQTVVRRDIIEKNKVKNEEALKAILRLMLNSTSYSISKLHNTMKSAGYAIGKTTTQQYISYIENSYFAFTVPAFSYKMKDQLMYPRKVYFIDNVFISLFSTKFQKNRGRAYENAVAVELKRKLTEEDICYWKSQDGEVDFAIRDGVKTMQLIQVCSDISDPDTKSRETRALLKASKELKCKNLLIITEDKEGEEKASWFGINGKIKYIPLWKWLLTK